MKIIRIETLIDVGDFSRSQEWYAIRDQIQKAIQAVEWPPNSGSFTLHDQPKGSGVKPIKENCMKYLQSMNWDLETRVDIAVVRRPGPIDATYPVGNRLFAVEWETGNISSTHRALNKMALGLLQRVLVGGALILPTREMYQYLTDRIGNFMEIQPYFPVWRALSPSLDEGLLVVIAIEHDSTSDDVPRIPKGTNGRALV